MDYGTIEIKDAFEMDGLLVALEDRRQRLINEGTRASLREIERAVDPLIRRVERERDATFEEGRR